VYAHRQAVFCYSQQHGILQAYETKIFLYILNDMGIETKFSSETFLCFALKINLANMKFWEVAGAWKMK
jgi:hypothetical protein